LLSEEVILGPLERAIFPIVQKIPITTPAKPTVKFYGLQRLVNIISSNEFYGL
jgi:hypothetical protein